jgi:hypothetical protein
VLPAFRHLVRSDALRVLWCIAAAALPFEMGAPPAQFPGVLSNPANLDLALVDDERQNVLASVTIARDQLLQGEPQPLYVPPIAGSAGRRYAIVARAVEIDPRAPIRVLGAANDSYRDGFASFAGATPGLDASFAYSCGSRQTAASR